MHAERRQGVFDGGDDGGRRRDGTALAGALTPSGLSGFGVSTRSMTHFGTSFTIGIK
jgi:hypothetical protein